MLTKKIERVKIPYKKDKHYVLIPLPALEAVVRKTLFSQGISYDMEKWIETIVKKKLEELK